MYLVRYQGSSMGIGYNHKSGKGMPVLKGWKYVERRKEGSEEGAGGTNEDEDRDNVIGETEALREWERE